MQKAIISTVAFILTIFSSWSQSAEGYSDAQILQAAENIIVQNHYCALITQGTLGFPKVRMMDSAPSFPDFTIWMATNPSTSKVQEIIANQKVALYYSDLSSPGYVSMQGNAELITHADTVAYYWKDDWSPFYTTKTSDDVILIKFTPTSLETVSYQDSVFSKSHQWKAPSYQFKQR